MLLEKLDHQEENSSLTADIESMFSGASFQEDDLSTTQHHLEEKENGDAFILEHPNNKALKKRDPKKYEEHKRKVEEKLESIRNDMSWDTTVTFLKEQGDWKKLKDGKYQTELDISNLTQCLQLIDTIHKVLKECNSLFGSNLYVNKIFLTSYTGEKHVGTAFHPIGNDQHTQYMNLNIPNNYSKDEITSIVYHEVTHLLDYDTDTDDQKWNNIGGVNLDSYGGPPSPKAYGNSNSHESKAVLLEGLMNVPTKVLEYVRGDTTGSLKKKVEIMTGCKINAAGDAFEETYNVNTFPQEYKSLGFVYNEYCLKWSEGAMNHHRRNAKLGKGGTNNIVAQKNKVKEYKRDNPRWAPVKKIQERGKPNTEERDKRGEVIYTGETLQSFGCNDTYITLENGVSTYIKVGVHTLDISKLHLMRESEDMPAGADMNKDVIYPQLIANFINKMRHDYIKPQLGAHSTPFGLSDDGYLQFDDEYTKSGRGYLKDAWDTNVCVLKNRETLGISNGDKSAKSTLITFLNLLYIQKI